MVATEKENNDRYKSSWGFCMPGCKKTFIEQLSSRPSQLSSPMSQDDVIENRATTKDGNAGLKEYAVDAFKDNRIDKKCKNVAIDQFCTSGIIVKPGESFII